MAVFDRKGKETGRYVGRHTGLVGDVPMSAIPNMIEDAAA